LVEVTAPLVGIFYRAPRTGAPPYVEVGAEVQEDTIIGIIEVMKLMNAVRAEVSGTVVGILVQDGSAVEYGQLLLRVSRGAQGGWDRARRFLAPRRQSEHLGGSRPRHRQDTHDRPGDGPGGLQGD